MSSLEGFQRDILLKMSLALVQIAIGLSGVGFGLYLLYRAFTTGRTRGRFGYADRATRPVSFWLDVVGYFFIVVISSQVVLPVLVGRRDFHALHSTPASGAMAQSPVPAADTPGCDKPGIAVCFVVAGAVPDVAVETLARYYTSLLGTPVGVLAPVALTREAGGLPLVDTKRSQVGIAALMRLVRDTYPALWDKGVTVIILTGNDLWLEDRPGWRYSFGRATARLGGGGLAVVSSARMDPAAYGEAPDPEVLERRVHAMVGKYLALLLYGESTSSDPASPAYDGIRSPTDLDRMQPFAPPR